jgi:hypothetical protein
MERNGSLLLHSGGRCVTLLRILVKKKKMVPGYYATLALRTNFSDFRSKFFCVPSGTLGFVMLASWTRPQLICYQLDYFQQAGRPRHVGPTWWGTEVSSSHPLTRPQIEHVAVRAPPPAVTEPPWRDSLSKLTWVILDEVRTQSTHISIISCIEVQLQVITA